MVLWRTDLIHQNVFKSWMDRGLDLEISQISQAMMIIIGHWLNVYIQSFFPIVERSSTANSTLDRENLLQLVETATNQTQGPCNWTQGTFPPEYSAPYQPSVFGDWCGTDECPPLKVWTKNESAQVSLKTIQYNSSLGLIDGKSYYLPVPLLTIKPNNDSSLQCFKGRAYSNDLLATSNLTCASDPGFTWGFSMFLVGVGVTLQVLWSVGIYVVWADATAHGKLYKYGRKSHGTLRGVADLSNALTEDLGDDHGTYSNDRLERALSKTRIGWTVDKGKDGAVDYIRLSSRRGAVKSSLSTKEGFTDDLATSFGLTSLCEIVLLPGPNNPAQPRKSLQHSERTNGKQEAGKWTLGRAMRH